MTTTELIKLLQENEHGGISGRPREISLTIPDFGLLADADFDIDSTGDGMFSEICLAVKAKAFYPAEQKMQEEKLMIENERGWNCPSCGMKLIGKTASGYPCDLIDLPLNFCPRCGQEVKWE